MVNPWSRLDAPDDDLRGHCAPLRIIKSRLFDRKHSQLKFVCLSICSHSGDESSDGNRHASN
jgi:hypothetical protein